MLLHHAERGAGPAVCLVHGLFGRSQNLGTLARRLAAGHRVISVDLRNHGASAHAAGMSYDAMSGDVFETLAALDALPCALVGHSMGGKVAMAAALQRPSLVRRLVVADIAPVAYVHGNVAIAEALRRLALTAGMHRGAADAALAAAVPDAAVRAFLLQNLALGAAPRWTIGLDWIAAGMADIEGWPVALAGAVYAGPALFIRGGRSGYVADAAWPAIAALFPAARLATLEGAGHWLHADQPEAFGGLVERFLAG